MRTRILGTLWLALAAALALAGTAGRAAAPPLYDFEGDVQGWQSMQAAAGVSVTQAEAKVGTGSLEWTYTPTTDDAELFRPMPGLKNGPSTLEFWLKCSDTASFQLFLGQQNG